MNDEKNFISTKAMFDKEQTEKEKEKQPSEEERKLFEKTFNEAWEAMNIEVGKKLNKPTYGNVRCNYFDPVVRTWGTFKTKRE